jgi:hypothetical protein
MVRSLSERIEAQAREHQERSIVKDLKRALSPRLLEPIPDFLTLGVGEQELECLHHAPRARRAFTEGIAPTNGVVGETACSETLAHRALTRGP